MDLSVLLMDTSLLQLTSIERNDNSPYELLIDNINAFGVVYFIIDNIMYVNLYYKLISRLLLQ